MKTSMFRFLLDPGWPYVLAGILMLLSAGLIPSEIELEDRELNLIQLRAERDAFKRLHDAYGIFLDEVGSNDASLAKRLTGAHLWMIPADQHPVTIIKTQTESPSHWIERAATASVPGALEVPTPPSRSLMRHSTLATLLEGSGRLWLFAGALVAIFIGLLLGAAPPVAEETGSSGIEPIPGTD